MHSSMLPGLAQACRLRPWTARSRGWKPWPWRLHIDPFVHEHCLNAPGSFRNSSIPPASGPFD
jgi:hypothetical protein